MSWGLVFRIRQTLKGSLWVLPLVGAVAGLLLGNASVWLGAGGQAHSRP